MAATKGNTVPSYITLITPKAWKLFDRLRVTNANVSLLDLVG